MKIIKTLYKKSKIDLEGLEFDGQQVKGLIADIGDTAVKTGEAMHYTGELGAVAEASKECDDAAKNAGLTTQEWMDSYDSSHAISEQDAVTNAIARIVEEAKELNGISQSNTDSKSFAEAWEDLLNTSEDDLEGLADDLKEAAEAGELTEEKFKELDSTEYFKNLTISAQEAVARINALTNASTQLSAMSSGVSAMSEALGTKQTDGFVDADTLAGFDAEIQGLDSWDDFQRLLGSSTLSMEECKEAANALATEWVNSNNFLAKLSETNKESYITQMENMGITNAREIATEALNAKLLAEKVALDEVDLSSQKSIDTAYAEVSSLKIR